MSRPTKATERYQRINDLFNLRKGGQAVVTSKELMESLGIGLRQLRLDMEAMRNLGAPLEYVARERGWRHTKPFDFSESIPLSADNVMQLGLAVATLEQVNQLPQFSGLTAVFEKIRSSVRRWLDREATAKAIYFDPLPDYEGGVHLPFFLRAIEETRQVVFDYQAFHAPVPKSYVFDPYFLRQHLGRWYVGGFSHQEKERFIRTFPLERIVGSPQVSGHFYKKPKDFQPSDYWRYIVGINRPKDGKVEKVLLEFSYLQGRYFLSQPFFTPFEIVENNDEKLVVKLEIMIDIELIRLIASYGQEVRVLAPENLIEQIQAFHQNALERYIL